MRMSRRKHLVAGLGGVALAACTAAVVLLLYGDVPPARRLVVLAALLAASQLVVASTRTRADLLAFPNADAAVLVGFVTVGPTWFMAIALPGLLLVHLLM